MKVNNKCHFCKENHGWKYSSGNDWYSKEDRSDFGTRDYRCQNCKKPINPSISPEDYENYFK